MRRPRSLVRRLRDLVSVALCLLEMAARRSRIVAGGIAAAGTRHAGSERAGRAAGATPAESDEGAEQPGRHRPRRLQLVAAGVVTVLVLGLALFGPLLRLVAKPLVASMGQHGGLDALPERSELFAADGRRLGVLHDGTNRRVVPLADIPEVMRQAVLAAEDQRFFRHHGYDRSAIGRALMANLRDKRVSQGGSTISQQLAKLNFVGNTQSVTRKIKELVYAAALEERFTKEELLKRYLNEVYFGSGAYGVAAASEEFFGVEPSGLNVERAALLAGLIRAPAALDPRTDPAAATARRNEVLDAMAHQGFIASEQAARAREAPLGVGPSRPNLNTEHYVVDAVQREFLSNPAFGETEAKRHRLLTEGGLQIRVTLDPRLQDAAANAAQRAPTGLATAIVAVDPSSGAIRALHNSGQPAARQSDVATQGRRQPGSAFKPLVAAAALEARMPQYQVFVGDGPIELDMGRGLPAWHVDNFGEADYGLVDVREALVGSVNTAFAQLATALGPEPIVDVARRLGVDVDAAFGTPAQRGPAIGIGGLAHGVSPLEVASAYGTLSTGGRRAAPYLIDTVLGPDGSELFRSQPAPEPAMSPSVAGAVVDMLQDVVAEGTGTRAQLPGWAPMGKTGTSDGSADAWFVGAVPQLATAVWLGHAEGGSPVGTMTGGSAAAPMWRQFMSTALRDAAPTSFALASEPSSGRPLELPPVRLCPWISGCS